LPDHGCPHTPAFIASPAGGRRHAPLSRRSGRAVRPAGLAAARRRPDYDATCFFLSSQQGGLAGEYIEPNEELSFRNFAAMLSARVAAFVKLKRQ